MPPPSRSQAVRALQTRAAPFSRERAALLLFLMAAVFRASLALALPVGYDEIFVMGIGLDDLRTSLDAYLFETPLTHSSAVTPLWWWVQSIPLMLMGDVSLLMLRLGPFLLGAATPVIAWYAARRRFGRSAALWFVAFIALSDVLIFSNSRGEFAESLLVPLIVLCVCLGDGPGTGWRRGVLWMLLLLTALVKGLGVIGLMAAADVVVCILAPRDRRRLVRGWLIGLAIALPPAVVYLIAAQVHFAGEPIVHEALTAPDVVTLVRRLLLDYSEVKAHVVGSVRDAAQVHLDYLVWPASAAVAPLLLAAVGAAIARLRRARWSPASRRDVARLRLAVWTVLGAAMVIGRGVLGARFHLIYLPAAWMLAALWLSDRRARHWRSTNIFLVALWAGVVGMTMAWRSWSDAALAPRIWIVASIALAALAALAGIGAVRKGQTVKAGVGASALLVAIGGLAWVGPLHWAPISRFEPLAGGHELTMLDATRTDEAAELAPHGQTLYIALANYYLAVEPHTESRLQRALHYARLETRRVPEDPRAWAYLGEALYRLGGAPDEIIAAWERSLHLAPNETLQARLDALRALLRERGA